MYRPPFLASSPSAPLSAYSAVPGGASVIGATTHPRAHSPNLYPPSAPRSTSSRLHSTGYSHPAAPPTQHRPTPMASAAAGGHPAPLARGHAASSHVLPKLKAPLTLQPRSSPSTSTQPLAMPMPMTAVESSGDNDLGLAPDSPALSALSDLSSLCQDELDDDDDDNDNDSGSVDQDAPGSSRSGTKRVSNGGGGRKRKQRHLDADEALSYEGETPGRCYTLTQEDHVLGLGYSKGTLKPFVCRGCSRRWKHRAGFSAHLETGCPRPFSASKNRRSAGASSSSAAACAAQVMGSSTLSGVSAVAMTRSVAAAPITRPNPFQPIPLHPPPPLPGIAVISRSTGPMPTPPLTPLDSPMPSAGERMPPPSTVATLLRNPDQPPPLTQPAPPASKPPARRGRPRLHPASTQPAHPQPPPTPIHCPCGQAQPPAFTGTAPRPFTPPPPSACVSYPHACGPAPPPRPPTTTTPLASPAVNPDTRVPMSAWPKCTLCAALGHPSCVAAHLMGSGHSAWFCTRCESARLATAKPSRRVPRSAIMAPLLGPGGRVLPMRRPVGASREEMVLPSLARQVGSAQANADGVYVVGGWMADRTAVRFPSIKMEGSESEKGLMVANAKPVARRPTRVVVVSMRKGDGDTPSVEQVAKEGRDELNRRLAERRPVSPPAHPGTPKISGNCPSALVLDHSIHAQQQKPPPPPPSSALASCATSALVKEDFIVPWRSSPVCLSPVLPEPLQSTPRRAAAAASSTASYMTTTTPLRGSAAPAWPASPSTILGSVHRSGGASASSTDFDDLLGGLAPGRLPASPLLPFPLGSMLGGLACLDDTDGLSSPSPRITLRNAQRNSGLGSPLKGKVKRNADEVENGISTAVAQPQPTPSPRLPASPVMSSLDKELAREVPAYRLPPSKRIRSVPALHFNKARRGSSAAVAKSGMLSAPSKCLCPSSSSSSFGGILPSTSPDLPPDWPASKLLCSPPPLAITPALAAATSLLVTSTPRQSTSNPVGWAGLIHLPSPMPTPCGDSLSAPIDLAMRGAGATDLMMLMSPLASPTQMAFSSPLASHAGHIYAHQAPPQPPQLQQEHKVEYSRYGTPAPAPATGPYSSLAPARPGMSAWSSSAPAPQAGEEEAGTGWDESFDDMVSLEPMDV